jgi:hypothetical protein
MDVNMEVIQATTNRLHAIQKDQERMMARSKEIEQWLIDNKNDASYENMMTAIKLAAELTVCIDKMTAYDKEFETLKKTLTTLLFMNNL